MKPSNLSASKNDGSPYEKYMDFFVDFLLIRRRS